MAVIALIAAPLAVTVHSQSSDASTAAEKRGNSLTLRFVVPAGVSLPAAMVVLHGKSAGDPLEFDIEQRTPLERASVTFRGITPGAKRVQLLDDRGRTLVLHRICVDHDDVTAEVPLAPLRLYGRVTNSDRIAPGFEIEFVDPEHPAVVLASARADAGGRYETTIWQRGDVVGYAFDEKPVSCSMFAKLTLGAEEGEREFNLKVARAGLTLSVVDATTGRPVPRAEVDRWVRNADDDVVHGGKAIADDGGQYRLTRYRDGSATFLVKAPGYRLAEVQEELRDGEHGEVRVALHPALGTGGRVYGADGGPIAGAVVMGGYPGDRTTRPILHTRTNAEGEFRFTSDPDDDIPFYVIARGHALAVTTLRASDDNVIQLEALAHEGMVYVLTNGGAQALPSRRLRAAPAGKAIVPEHVLDEVAKANGLRLTDLIRTDRRGACALPRYLGRGWWDIYLRADRSGDVQRLGSIRTPLRGSLVLNVSE